jgi:hypothetical protein
MSDDELVISPIRFDIPIPYRRNRRGPTGKSPMALAMQELRESPRGASRFFARANYFTTRSAIRRASGNNTYRWASLEPWVEGGVEGIMVWRK